MEEKEAAQRFVIVALDGLALLTRWPFFAREMALFIREKENATKRERERKSKTENEICAATEKNEAFSFSILDATKKVTAYSDSVAFREG